MVVVAPTTVEAIRSAGGWLFDNAMTGWDVLVLVAEPGDYRPLRILGARAAELEAAVTSRVHGPRPHVLAVDAELVESDARVRRLVLKSLEHGLTEVRVWGRQWPTDIDGEIGPVRHRLSVAARAFKTQALAAAAAPVDSIPATEVFHSGELLPNPSSLPDLIPVS